MEINEDTPLDKLLGNYPEAIPVLARHGMHSISCPSELYLPLKRIAKLRDMSIDRLVHELRDICISDLESISATS